MLTMLSGAVYRVSDVDLATTAVWLAAEDVVVCEDGPAYKIINKDDGDTAEAAKIDG